MTIKMVKNIVVEGKTTTVGLKKIAENRKYGDTSPKQHCSRNESIAVENAAPGVPNEDLVISPKPAPSHFRRAKLYACPNNGCKMCYSTSKYWPLGTNQSLPSVRECAKMLRQKGCVYNKRKTR